MECIDPPDSLRGQPWDMGIQHGLGALQWMGEEQVRPILTQ